MYDKKFLPLKENAITGRDQAIFPAEGHQVFGRTMVPPFPVGIELIYFGMGCFWGAERLFWQQSGVWITAAGYMGGYTSNPTYEEVCSGGTGHTEIVMVGYEPDRVALEQLLLSFWQSHDPTQGMRQGNDLGTQYRSAIYTTNYMQLRQAKASCMDYQSELTNAGFGKITTEIGPATDFYFAEEYHQQYLIKNPQGYCGLGGTGVCLSPSDGK